ncbi:MAG TPA: Xaa-Pro peptidase family protein, partial [Gemmatimonadales bacterium]|nr:Xaa-Pro peptidase family protein [Gemmatimonadales bacterium]
ASARAPHHPHPQMPELPAETFVRRLGRLREELQRRRLDVFFATPSTNYQYFTGYHPGRSERLIALLVPAEGDPLVICPAFEVERIRRATPIPDVRGWEEHDDPYGLVADALRAIKPRGRGALEPTTDYHTFRRLADALSGWQWTDGAALTERLRIVKAPEELALIRRAVEITEAAMTATFAHLRPGMAEREVARVLSEEMQRRGASGGGLVQFGPSSALPHGGPGGTTLARETVVLIDCGCRVGGYTSDLTRTIWFGDTPSEEFRRVFNLVHDAQTAAMELGRPFVIECQALDRAARAVITDAGLGPYFTHRLGHGMGMDGHEAPYLVEGNATRLEPGMVFTIEPGVYQLGKFGVRIEDDCVMGETGIEVLSRRPARL